MLELKCMKNLSECCFMSTVVGMGWAMEVFLVSMLPRRINKE